MRFLYHSSRPGISPQIAAAIHLGILPEGRAPHSVEWERIPYRMGFPSGDEGGLFLLGRTDRGDEVYVLTYPPQAGELVMKSFQAALNMLDVQAGEYRLIDCAASGGEISKEKKRLRDDRQKEYFQLVGLVHSVKGGVPR